MYINTPGRVRGDEGREGRRTKEGLYTRLGVRGKRSRKDMRRPDVVVVVAVVILHTARDTRNHGDARRKVERSRQQSLARTQHYIVSLGNNKYPRRESGGGRHSRYF